MIYLIDAYNLMHAVGYWNKNTPLNRMESSRRRLIDWLADHARQRPHDQFHLVFDAQSAPHPSADTVVRGVVVSFAFRETADEYLVRKLNAAKPGAVSLVSNDSVIQAAAKRVDAPVFACSAFVDLLITPTARQEEQAAIEEKPIPHAIETDLLTIFSQRPKRKR